MESVDTENSRKSNVKVLQTSALPLGYRASLKRYLPTAYRVSSTSVNASNSARNSGVRFSSGQPLVAASKQSITAGFVAAAAFPTLVILANLPDDLTARLMAGCWLGLVGICRIVWGEVKER